MQGGEGTDPTYFEVHDVKIYSRSNFDWWYKFLWVAYKIQVSSCA